jgi:hypothetical protein
MANSKTKANNPADALSEFDRLREALAMTHTEIPALLATELLLGRELGLAEARADSDVVGGLRAQLSEAQTQRASAVRRRAATVDGIVALEAPLRAARIAVEAERQAYAVEAVRAFEARYSAAVVALQTLWAEGEALGRALKVQVDMPLPVRIVTSRIDGSVKALPLRSDLVTPVDSESAKLAAKIDSLDGALVRIGAITQAKELDLRHHRLASDRGTKTEYTGTYRVLLPFGCQTDGLEFTIGQLVDGSLLGPGTMYRLMAGKKYIVPAELAAVA